MLAEQKLVSEALRDTRYEYARALKYYFEAGDEEPPEFTSLNLIENLEEEVNLENGLPDYHKLLDAIRLRVASLLWTRTPLISTTC